MYFYNIKTMIQFTLMFLHDDFSTTWDILQLGQTKLSRHSPLRTGPMCLAPLHQDNLLVSARHEHVKPAQVPNCTNTT